MHRQNKAKIEQVYYILGDPETSQFYSAEQLLKTGNAYADIIHATQFGSRARAMAIQQRHPEFRAVLECSK